MRKVAIWFIILSLVLCSCTTIKSYQSYNISNPDISDLCNIKLKEVSVIIDHVKERELEKQIETIIQGLLLKKNKGKYISEGDLRVNINQRSFIEGVEQKNSINITCELRKADDKLISVESIYITGNSSILSSVEQYRYINELVGKIYAKRNFLSIWIKKE